MGGGGVWGMGDDGGFVIAGCGQQPTLKRISCHWRTEPCSMGSSSSQPKNKPISNENKRGSRKQKGRRRLRELVLRLEEG